MVDAGVEEHVVANQVAERRPSVLREPAVAAPVIGHRAAAMGDDEAQRRKILKRSAVRNCMNAVVSALR